MSAWPLVVMALVITGLIVAAGLAMHAAAGLIVLAVLLWWVLVVVGIS